MSNESTISTWTIRWILLVLSGTLAVALVLRGNVVFGVIIGAMVVARALLFVRMRRRRELLRQRIMERRAGRP